jgi:hypothetical protein
VSEANELDRLVKRHLAVNNQSINVQVSAPSKRLMTTDSRSLGSKLRRFTPCRVPGLDSSGRATAERAIATRGLVWRNWKSEANCSAVAGTVKRWCWLFVSHGSKSWDSVSPNAQAKPPRSGAADTCWRSAGT